MPDERFWILDAANAENKIDAVQVATGLNIVALVDEEYGGVVAYVADTPDGREADKIAKMLNNYVPSGLRLSFEPNAILEHFDGEPAYEKLKAAADANPKKMNEECANSVMADPLYEEFHRQCIEIFKAMTGEEYGP